ncbi:MAG: endolytic transglycosylase MltG [Actinomycetota bacterium]|jgi:UPF0755 protein|nr:endolytic transglycosylase MltG [Actinomycetota bacterium]MDA3016314.1 endolytic transglycosylase MltG [Actinomycetota bacterium]MDA3029206.1 endolytic transglycosylase MltG [Actinomycetota bacterium]
MRSDLLADDEQARLRFEADSWDQPDEVPMVETPGGRGAVVRWFVWGIIWAVVGGIIAIGITGWHILDRMTVDAVAGEPVGFDVAEDDDLAAVAARLAADGLIADADVFVWYAGRQGGVELVPGFYRIPLGAHMGDVLGTLRTPPNETYQRVTFPEGFTVVQIAARLDDRIPTLSAERFVELSADPTRRVPWRPPDISSLEGLLFPDTYQVSNADNEGQVIERMIELMERVALQEELEAGAERLGLTPYEVLTVASMIEREAKVDADRSRIARVIYNRLALGWNLEIDATLFYGADPDATFSELRSVDSPYNTYERSGLPPTPIANPGRASIRAALNPAPNPASGDPICSVLDDPTVGCVYLFYVLADADGSHAFAVTLEQHERNVAAARAAGLLG